MNFIERIYSAEEMAALPDGLVDYEVALVARKDALKVAVTCLFRFSIEEPDKDGSVKCTEATQTFNRMREPMMAKTGEPRVTVAAKEAFSAFLAERYSAYGVEFLEKIADDAELAKIEANLKGAVSDGFAA